MNYIGTCYSPVVRETPGPSDIRTSFSACRLLRVDGYYCSSQADRKHFAWKNEVSTFCWSSSVSWAPWQIEASPKFQGWGTWEPFFLKPGRMVDYLACRRISQANCKDTVDLGWILTMFIPFSKRHLEFWNPWISLFGWLNLHEFAIFGDLACCWNPCDLKLHGISVKRLAKAKPGLTGVC